jgi:hypothetical protein
MHALCGIRNNDPGFRVNEDSTCPRPLGYRDRLLEIYCIYIVDRKRSTVISSSASLSRGLYSNLGQKPSTSSEDNCWDVALKQATAATYSSLTHSL